MVLPSLRVFVGVGVGVCVLVVTSGLRGRGRGRVRVGVGFGVCWRQWCVWFQSRFNVQSIGCSSAVVA